MKIALLLALLVVAASAAPQQQRQQPREQRKYDDVQIVELKSDNPGDGNYDFNYKLSDGTSRDEHGELRKIGEEFGQAVRGVISWTSPEGETFKLEYIADENGFQPIGAHLPKAA